jgi:signal transduction histidine kinase
VKYFPDSGSYFVENIVDSFDAFPFMWLLSVVLVKIIEIRTRLHESEEQRILAEQEMQLRQTQLKTLHEIARGIQHHINNPLSVIVLSIGKAQKEAEENQKMTRHLRIIEDEVNRIIAALSDFSKVNTYAVESIDPHIGDMAARGTVR